MAFEVNKYGRNFKKGQPLCNDLRNQTIELAQLHSFREVGRQLRIDPKTVSNIVKHYRVRGTTSPKPLNHIRSGTKYSFEDSILLGTIVQAKGSSSLRELRDNLAMCGDYGVLSTSTISRHVRKKLPSTLEYS